MKNQKGEKEKNTFLNGKVHAVWNFSVANIVEKVVKSRFSLVYHNFYEYQVISFEKAEISGTEACFNSFFRIGYNTDFLFGTVHQAICNTVMQNRTAFCDIVTEQLFSGEVKSVDNIYQCARTGNSISSFNIADVSNVNFCLSSCFGDISVVLQYFWIEAPIFV